MGNSESGDGPVTDAPVDDASGHTFDRRSMLKKVGVAGAAAWVAPVVIESLVSPAAAASIPPGTYRLNLSSEQCNPTPVNKTPAVLTPPVTCGSLAANWTAAQFDIASQAAVDNFGLVISNCNRRFAIQVNSTNPKVTFTQAGSGSGNARKLGQCVTPAVTATQVTWLANGSSDRNGYFILITVAP
jgi:hypothetical protein